MTEEIESLKRVVQGLEIGGFEYMLTGSMAMSFYFTPRMTRDSDIVVILSAEDSGKFVNLFSEEYFVDEYAVRESLEKNLIFNMFDKKSFFKIDFIIKQDDEYENLKFERKNKLRIDGLEIYVISIEDLIISKLIWAMDSQSETQLNDIRNLMKNKIDLQYLNSQISNLNLKEIYNIIHRANE
ncbi:MAG: nucleotidyltransferase [Ignavibacteria bacterium]|nr:nucleotidyltransferase [Ignavibacteria bacterium]